jgi:hypothetical protein
MKRPSVIFPDGEIELIDALKNAFSQIDETLTNNVFVSVKKASPQHTPQPTKQVIVRSDGGQTTDNGTLKNERFGINIYCTDYRTASQLSNVVEAILKSISTPTIKKVDIDLSATRVNYQNGEEEQRFLTCVALMASTNYNL